MENQEKKPTKIGFEMEMEIEMVDLTDKHCKNRQGSFPGGAKRLSADGKVSTGEVGFQVTKNLLSFQATDENDIDVARRTFDLFSSNGSGSIGQSIARDKSAQKLPTDSLDIQEGKEDDHDIEDAGVTTADKTYFLQKHDLQFKHSSERQERQLHATPKKPMPGFRKDDLYFNAAWEENQPGFEKTPDQRFFIAKHKSPVKRLPSEQDAKRHQQDANANVRLDFSQAFVDSSRRNSGRRGKKRNTNSDGSDELEKYWREVLQSRNEVASEESFLEQGMSEARHQWYRSKETRPNSHSPPTTKLKLRFILLALIVIIITVAITVAVWEYLKSILSDYFSF